MKACTRNVSRHSFLIRCLYAYTFSLMLLLSYIVHDPKKKNVTEAGNGEGALWFFGKNYCPSEAERGVEGHSKIFA